MVSIVLASLMVRPDKSVTHASIGRSAQVGIAHFTAQEQLSCDAPHKEVDFASRSEATLREGPLFREAASDALLSSVFAHFSDEGRRGCAR